MESGDPRAASEGYPVEPPIPSPQSPAPWARIDLSSRDLPCLQCGYNLRGMSPDGNCPECGNAVRRSLQGNLLIFSGPEYLACLHRGLALVLVASVAAIVVLASSFAGAFLLGWIGGPPPFGLMLGLGLVLLAAYAIFLLGWWFFGVPDPATLPGEDDHDWPRRAIRACVVALAGAPAAGIAAGAAAAYNPQWAPLQSLAGISIVLALLALFFMSLLRIRRLAPRLPDSDFRRHAQMYLWLLPLITVLSACICPLIGLLIAAVLYLVLLNNLRMSLKHIREAQAKQPSSVGT